MSNRIYIIAYNIYEFKSYVEKKARECEALNVTRINNPYGYNVGNEDHYTSYINVSSLDTLRGIRDINGVFVGTYYNRDDIWDIITYISFRKNKDIVAALPEKHRKLLKVTNTPDYQFNPITNFGISDTMSMPSISITPSMPIINIPPSLISGSTFKINPVDTTSDKIIPPKTPPFITNIDITVTRKSDDKNG